MRFLIFAFIFLAFKAFPQSSGLTSNSIADCEGATAIITPGTYTLQFTGGSGNINNLDAFPSLDEIPEKNSLWFYFIAPFDGRLSFEAVISSGLVQMIAFQNDESDLCAGLIAGTSEIKRLIQQPTKPNVSLSLLVGENSLFPLDLKKDQMVMFFFNTREKGKPLLNFTLKYEGLNGYGNDIEALRKKIDQRKDTATPALNIMVRDIETGNPVVANMNLSGPKNKNSLYNGSDFLFTIEKSGKVAVSCDAPGYFFMDRAEPVAAATDHEMVVWMQPLGHGKVLRLEEIDFLPGTSEFLPNTIAKLNRLRDFLALNAGVHIEIQGHVHALGENTQAAQKISEARAKKVMLFLIDNGISKDRMTSVGYGNTVPIYPRPQFSYQEQANRRVEIKIL